MIDITDMTDAALEAFLDASTGATVVVEHLTPAERRSVCDALGAPAPIHWVCDIDLEAPEKGDSFDYEGAILDEADAAVGAYL